MRHSWSGAPSASGLQDPHWQHCSHCSGLSPSKPGRSSIPHRHRRIRVRACTPSPPRAPPHPPTWMVEKFFLSASFLERTTSLFSLLVSTRGTATAVTRPRPAWGDTRACVSRQPPPPREAGLQLAPSLPLSQLPAPSLAQLRLPRCTSRQAAIVHTSRAEGGCRLRLRPWRPHRLPPPLAAAPCAAAAFEEARHRRCGASSGLQGWHSGASAAHPPFSSSPPSAAGRPWRRRYSRASGSCRPTVMVAMMFAGSTRTLLWYSGGKAVSCCFVCIREVSQQGFGAVWNRTGADFGAKHVREADRLGQG